MSKRDSAECAVSASAGAVRYRNVIALTMLLLASIGAVIAGWSAINQQSSTALGRRIAQAQMLELSDRGRLIQESQASARLQRRLQAHMAEVDLQRTTAGRTRLKHADYARLMDLASSESFLLAGASRPFLSFLPNMVSDGATIDERLVGLAATMSLQRQGVKASWTEPISSSAEPTSNASQSASTSGVHGHLEYIEKSKQSLIDGQVVTLSQVVVGFVVALVLLTLADLSSGKKRLSYGFYGAGLCVAVASLGVALATDPGLMPIVSGIAVGFVLFLSASYALGWLGASAEVDPAQPQSIDAQGFAGSAMQGFGRSDKFSRSLIVGVAIAALVSAIIGYWFSLANSRAEDAAQVAYEQELDVVKRGTRGTTAVLGTFQDLVELYESRVRCQNARNRAALALDNKIAQPADILETEAALRCTDVESREKATRVGLSLGELDGAYGRHADPRFPFLLQQHIIAATPAANTADALAMWDGFSERATYWNEKATTLLACLTIVAIALYIFGQSLAMAQLRATRAMAGCAAILTAAAMGWSLAAWLTPDASGEAPGATCLRSDDTLGSPPPSNPDVLLRSAAINYATGVAEARAALDEREFQSAIHHLECALIARPHFSMAHAELGEARAISQSAHRSNAYYSLPSKDRLEGMLQNARTILEIAAKQGIEPNAFALNTYAVALWANGVRDGKIERLREALDAVDRAIEWAAPLENNRRNVSKDQARNFYPWLSILPLLHLNRSLFLIANGRIEEARAAVETAQSLHIDRDWGLRATMVTAAALLDKYCENLQPIERCNSIRPAVKRFTQALVTGAWGQETSVAMNASKQNGIRFAAAVTPSRVSWAALPADIDPEKDRLSVVWSVANTQWGVFDALPQFSPAIDQGLLRRGAQGQFLLTQNTLVASEFKRCLPPGRYRAELYRNGVSLAVADAELSGPTLEAARVEELNLALCLPPSWKAWVPEPSQRRRHEPMVGFIAADGRPAAFLFALPLPESIDATDLNSQTAYAVERALRALLANGIIDGTLAELKVRLSGCKNPAERGLIQAVIKGAGGIAYAAIVLADFVDPVHACDFVNSITTMHALPR